MKKTLQLNQSEKQLFRKLKNYTISVDLDYDESSMRNQHGFSQAFQDKPQEKPTQKGFL